MLNGLVNSRNDMAIVTAFLAVVTAAVIRNKLLKIGYIYRIYSPAAGAPQVFTNVNTNWIPKYPDKLNRKA